MISEELKWEVFPRITEKRQGRRCTSHIANKYLHKAGGVNDITKYMTDQERRRTSHLARGITEGQPESSASSTEIVQGPGLLRRPRQESQQMRKCGWIVISP